MEVKVLASSSAGNCIILKSKNGCQLLLDCGIKYEDIIINLDLANSINIFISHEHKDHSLSKDKFKKRSIDIFNGDNLEVGKIYDIDIWQLMPIKLFHNVPCLGAIIINKEENLKILFATDTKFIPMEIVDTQYDLQILECNYNEDYIIDNAYNLEQLGFENHLSQQELHKWLSNRKNKTKNLVLSHISTSGKLNENNLINYFKGQANKIYVAKKGLKVEI